jgi:hypothetical protein
VNLLKIEMRVNEMETVFENEITLTPNILYEFMLAQSGAASKYGAITMIIGFAIIAIVGYIDKNLILLFMMIILTLIVLLSLKFFPLFLSNKIYKKRLLMNNGKQLKMITRFTENIHIVTANNKEYEYRQVTKIYETQNLLILKIGTIVGMLLDKNNFKLGDLEAFRKFIKEKCPSVKYNNSCLK